MIQPSIRNVFDRLAHPCKADWRRQYEDTNYQASFQIDQFRQENSSPAVQSLVNLGVQFQAKIDSDEIDENKALLGVAQALESGIPAGPVSVAIATVGQNIMDNLMKGHHPKYGGLDDPLNIAETFADAATEQACQMGDNLEAASEVLKSGVHSTYNHITIAENVLNLVGSEVQCNQEQAVALLARNVINDHHVDGGDVGAVGMSALDWFANHSDNSQIRDLANQAMHGYQERKAEYTKALENQPWWATSCSGIGRFERGNQEHMVAELEQVFQLAGPGSITASVSPEHRTEYASELIWEAKQMIAN